MALFTKKTWKNRLSEYPTRRKLTKENGTTELVTVARSEGTVSQEGDAFSAANMNNLENRISKAIGAGDLPAELGADIISAIDALNTGLDDYRSTNLTGWEAAWQGGVTYAVNTTLGIRKLFGNITHKTATTPEWGEVVGTLQGVSLTYAMPFLVYSTRGQVYNAFVLTADGKIRVYGSDKSKLTNAGERLEFCIAF